MKVLVTYLSSSGNTKRVAEAIYNEIEGEKELREMSEVRSLDGYDLAFVGFPIVGSGAPSKAKRFLSRTARGKRTALFVTHGMPADMEKLRPMLEKCRQAAGGSEVVGMYDCQGKMAGFMTKVLRLYPDREVRQWVRSGGDRVGVGHPNAWELSGASDFAREVVTRCA